MARETACRDGQGQERDASFFGQPDRGRRGIRVLGRFEGAVQVRQGYFEIDCVIRKSRFECEGVIEDGVLDQMSISAVIVYRPATYNLDHTSRVR